MIIFLSELQKEHLKLLHKHSTQVLVDFCKLAIDYLNNGLNEKKCNLAAEKLEVSPSETENLIYAILFLLVEGCKYNLSDVDFKSSLAIAGFSNEQQEILAKLYESKKIEISESLCLLQQKDLSYQDLHWRFEVQVCSRNSSQQVKPSVALDFVLRQPKNFGDSESAIGTENFSNKCTSVVTVNSNIEEAKAASQCHNVVQHVMLRSDLPNLLHMTNKLEQALKESKCQHVRKVQRALQ